MRSDNNVWGRRVTLRELSQKVGKTYEHCRRIVSGEPVVSEDMNTRLCHLLNLDAERMWALAAREKVSRRYGSTLAADTLPVSELQEAWRVLAPEDKERVIQLANALAIARQAEQSADSAAPTADYSRKRG